MADATPDLRLPSRPHGIIGKLFTHPYVIYVPMSMPMMSCDREGNRRSGVALTTAGEGGESNPRPQSREINPLTITPPSQT